MPVACEASQRPAGPAPGDRSAAATRRRRALSRDHPVRPRPARTLPLSFFEAFAYALAYLVVTSAREVIDSSLLMPDQGYRFAASSVAHRGCLAGSSRDARRSLDIARDAAHSEKRVYNPAPNGPVRYSAYLRASDGRVVMYADGTKVDDTNYVASNVWNSAWSAQFAGETSHPQTNVPGVESDKVRFRHVQRYESTGDINYVQNLALGARTALVSACLVGLALTNGCGSERADTSEKFTSSDELTMPTWTPMASPPELGSGEPQPDRWGRTRSARANPRK